MQKTVKTEIKLNLSEIKEAIELYLRREKDVISFSHTLEYKFSHDHNDFLDGVTVTASKSED